MYFILALIILLIIIGIIAYNVIKINFSLSKKSFLASPVDYYHDSPYHFNMYRGHVGHLISYPMYIINLDRSVERKNYFLQDARRIQFQNFTLLQAVDGSQDIQHLFKKYSSFLKKDVLRKTNKEYGCLFSHLLAIEKAVHDDQVTDYVIICEDDVDLKSVYHWETDLQTYLKNFMPPDFDIAIIHTFGNMTKNPNKRWSLHNKKGSTLAYVVKKSSCQKVLLELEDKRCKACLADSAIFEIFPNVYYTPDTLFFENALVADSQMHSIQNYFQSKWVRQKYISEFFYSVMTPPKISLPLLYSSLHLLLKPSHPITFWNYGLDYHKIFVVAVYPTLTDPTMDFIITSYPSEKTSDFYIPRFILEFANQTNYHVTDLYFQKIQNKKNNSILYWKSATDPPEVEKFYSKLFSNICTDIKPDPSFQFVLFFEEEELSDKIISIFLNGSIPIMVSYQPLAVNFFNHEAMIWIDWNSKPEMVLNDSSERFWNKSVLSADQFKNYFSLFPNDVDQSMLIQLRTRFHLLSQQKYDLLS